MRRLILAAALVVALQPAAFARSAMETNQLVDDNGVPIGTAANPLFVSGGAGGGGSANAATASNAADGQATSTTNQQNVVWNYLFNGTTWDRWRGTGGAANVNVANPYATTTGNALQPPTAASGKILVTATDVAANTSTTLAAANPNRIAGAVQCGNVAGTSAAATAISETGATLTSANFGAGGSIFLPASSGGPVYFSPPIATLTAITAYTATAQRCVLTEYLR